MELIMNMPPLLVCPRDALSPADRASFNDEVAGLAIPDDDGGKIVSVPFPLVMYHRIDGIWIQVSDLGSFHCPPPAPPADREPPDAVACDDEG